MEDILKKRCLFSDRKNVLNRPITWAYYAFEYLVLVA